MSALIELQTAVQQATERISPAVVAVGRGAGVIVGPDRILTNAHNLTGPEVEVRLADGHTERAAVLGADLDGDLAVLRVATGAGPVADWADDGPGLGAAVLALGAPRRGPSRVTVGFVSAVEQPFRGPRGRRLRGFEHTAPVGRGSSGGPVVDLEGRVVGIDTHRRGEGLYLALPASSELHARIERLGRGETPPRRRLGIAVAPSAVAARLRAAVGLTSRDGVLVRSLDPDGPAGRAGLREGDLIVAVDGTAVASPDALLDALDALDAASDTATLAIVRGETDDTVTVSFATAADAG
jgi:S1-C subfamily serine protease